MKITDTETVVTLKALRDSLHERFRGVGQAMSRTEISVELRSDLGPPQNKYDYVERELSGESKKTHSTICIPPNDIRRTLIGDLMRELLEEELQRVEARLIALGVTL